MPLEQAIDAINREVIEPRVASGQLGGEYRITLAGTADKLLETWQALRWNILLALLVTYLLMAALFESWLYPFVIILSVPLGAVGGFLGLQTREPIPHALALRRSADARRAHHAGIRHPHRHRGQQPDPDRPPVAQPHAPRPMTPNEAILESVRTRIRPIFMTTSTTVLGLSPLVLFPGAGAELYRGLGAVVLGGLIVSTIFTLVLVPTLFSLMMDTKTALVRLWRGE